jgi:hypothetical protein
VVRDTLPRSVARERAEYTPVQTNPSVEAVAAPLVQLGHFPKTIQ